MPQPFYSVPPDSAVAGITWPQTHRDLFTLSTSLREALRTLDSQRIHDVVFRFYRDFVCHVWDEDLMEGTLKDIAHREPQLSSIVRKLREDHEEMLRILQDLVYTSLADLDRLVALSHRFLSVFEVHQRTEEQLVDDLFYRDDHIGGVSD